MLLLLASAQADDSNPVIKRFYDLLTGQTAPSEKQEEEFFGTKSNLRGLLQNAGKWPIKVPENLLAYEHTKTPVWTYLRDHSDLFLPLGAKMADEAILYSEPFSYTKSGRIRNEKWIDVIFISDLHNPKAGYRNVKISLGGKSDPYLINIDSTLLCGSNGYSIPDYASRLEPPDIFRAP
jgi:hypothetical protein